VLVCKGFLSGTDALWHQVTIVQKDFNLLRKDHALEFLRQMYNFGPEMCVLEDNIDADKEKALQSIQEAGKKIKSFTAQVSVKGHSELHQLLPQHHFPRSSVSPKKQRMLFSRTIMSLQLWRIWNMISLECYTMYALF
jgi:hypothetical protein